MRTILSGITLAAALLANTLAVGNNIQVSNVQLVNHDVPSTTVDVQFDIQWENSWRVSYPPANWDAAWVFVKYRLHSTGQWQPVLLNVTGNVAPSGSLLSIGLLDPTAAFDPVTNPGVGAFLHRSADGSGAFALNGVKLQWNYGSIGYVDIAEVKVFAIEMVNVPQGAFAAGSGGTEPNAFTLTTINTGVATVAPGGSGSLGGQAGGYPTGQAAPANASWPNGYKAFYCMKYEISQQQYVDFLNTLSRDQQNTRTGTDVSGMGITNRYVMSNSSINLFRNGIRCDATLPALPAAVTFYCDGNGNGTGGEAADGQWIACNYLSWGDLAAYLDWSGLRPMTELEFEKACRGDLMPVADEYPWGATLIATGPYSLTNGDAANEFVAAGYSNNLGNASFNATTGGIGPVRVGIFAASNGNSGRVTSGASYYGIMELGGNVVERLVTMGNPSGLAFAGNHGNGQLDVPGEANVLAWPDPTALGAGLRGGDWSGGASKVRTSDRSLAAFGSSVRGSAMGGRGVRSAQ